MEKNKKTNIKSKSKKTTKKNNTTKTKTTKIKNNLLDDKNYKLAEKYFKAKDYDNAYKEYLNICEKYPKNKKIYKRLIESITHNYTYKENSRAFKTAFDDYITTYKILCTKKELKTFENKLKEYKQIKAKGSNSKFILITFSGFLGVHKFIEKKYLMGVVYLFTLGLFGIGVIYDLLNDYDEYENDFQVNIIRYIISIILIIIGIFRINTSNFYYLIIASIIFTPIVYSKILKLIPNIIKIIAIIVLCYLGFKTITIIDTVPNKILGTWITENENTNFKSIEVKYDKSTIKFNDREQQIGNNEYNSTNKVLKVYVSATNIYKFRLNMEDEEICTYNDSKKCIISFKRHIEEN